VSSRRRLSLLYARLSDRRGESEANRLVVDSVADLLLCPATSVESRLRTRGVSGRGESASDVGRELARQEQRAGSSVVHAAGQATHTFGAPRADVRDRRGA